MKRFIFIFWFLFSSVANSEPLSVFEQMTKADQESYLDAVSSTLLVANLFNATQGNDIFFCLPEKFSIGAKDARKALAQNLEFAGPDVAVSVMLGYMNRWPCD